MSWHTHPDASRLVREHWFRAQCFIVAQREPCITIRDDIEVAAVDRFLHGSIPEVLDAWSRPECWFIAVVVCPGDDTEAIARYVKANRLDPHRVHFYLHPDATSEALRDWRDAGFPLDRVDTEGRGGVPLTDWGAPHGVLGLHFNLQVLEDALRT